jgi:aminopeptidase N
MWIHESFTTYSENLFLDYHFGTEASNTYVTGTRKNIQNDKPIIGNYNVNNSGSSDMYYKGANMLHTLRQIIDNDKKWRSILVGLNKDFFHQTVTTLQIENYIDKYFEIDLKPFFNQYLRTVKTPTLVYKLENNNLLYKWSNVVDGFSIPIKVFIDSTSQWIRPTSRWKKLLSDKNINSFSVDNNFYIETENKSD